MKSAPAIKTSLNKESGKLPTPAATPRPGNSPKETIASGKRISKETLEALIDNESASAEQTARTAPMTNCDGNVTNNGLKRPSVKVSGQTPLVSNQGHNAPRKGNEKPSKRKRGTASEEEPEHNKRRKDDRSTVHVEEHAQGAKNHCLKEKHKPDDPNANHGKPASRGAKPRGLRNEKDACYINAVLQAIANIPMMADHYRSLADKVLPEVAEWVARNSKKWDSQAEEVLKVLLEKNKSEM